MPYIFKIHQQNVIQKVDFSLILCRTVFTDSDFACKAYMEYIALMLVEFSCYFLYKNTIFKFIFIGGQNQSKIMISGTLTFKSFIYTVNLAKHISNIRHLYVD